MSTNIEDTIVYNLVNNEEYTRKVLPFLKEEYFEEPKNKVLLSEIAEFTEKYKKVPSTNALKVHVEARTDLINDDHYEDIIETIDQMSVKRDPDDKQWLIDQTEMWCQERAIFNAIQTSFSIIKGDDKTRTKLILPELLSDALSVNFQVTVGHDYFKDAAKRWEFYQNVEAKVPFDIELLNIITGGGVVNKTLNIFMAGTNGGKSALLCHIASAALSMGKNVMYVSLEMSEEEIARRIDANLMNVDSDKIDQLNRKIFATKLKDIYSKTQGRLIIKEFPGGGSTNSAHIRYLIKEAQLKSKFKPDILIIDYLGICGSSRYKAGGVNPSYYLKSVAEEIRSLGQEFNVPVFSGAQYNREGMSNSDVDLTNIAESIGITHTADLVVALIRNEEMDNMGQICLKQLKNRYNSTSNYRRFVLGVDFAKSRFYNLNNSAQDTFSHNYAEQDTSTDKPLMDERFGHIEGMKKKQKKPKDFEGFKV